MGVEKASLVAGLSRAAESMMVSTATHTGCVTVLYVDRGVIVLNKPPGLVSQGTSRPTRSTKSDAKKSDGPRTRPRVISAFNNVLDGTAPFCCRQGSLSQALTSCLRCRAVGLRRRYDLDANPYPVHRLDKVSMRYPGSGAPLFFFLACPAIITARTWKFNGLFQMPAGNHRRSCSRAHEGLGAGALTTISYTCHREDVPRLGLRWQPSWQWGICCEFSSKGRGDCRSAEFGPSWSGTVTCASEHRLATAAGRLGA